MRTRRASWSLSLFALAASACASSQSDSGASKPGGGGISGPTPTYTSAGGSSGTGTTYSGATGAAGSSGSDPTISIVDPTTPPDPTTTATVTSTDTKTGAGRLTAGTWDDNLNFGFYLSYLSETTGALLGAPLIDRSARMVILIKGADGQPAAGATVTVTSGQGRTWSSVTGAEGRVLYFPAWASVAAGEAVTVTASLGGLTVSAPATATATTVELSLGASALPPVGSLDLAFLIDTTGSMGDELSYIQTELDAIVGGIATQFPQVSQRFALIVYRDIGDEYVVRSFNFTSVLSTFRGNLSAQGSNGGGDMPEAVDQALAAAGELGWNGGATARVLFWIADAPHHDGLEGQVISALGAVVAQGVHIYPVAASGIDDLAEFTMRTAAEVTGGRYLFLTDDSGIGGGHAEPHIPCYYVTTLAAAMRRMIATEIAGIYQPPAAADIIRTGGELQNQQCSLSGGEVVTAW